MNNFDGMLVQRNIAATQAYHKTALQHYVRRALLRLLGHIPIPTMQPAIPERILIIRPDHLGDMLLSTPAIEALKEARPDAEIHVLAGPWSAELIASYEAVDWVVTLPFPAFNRRSPKENLQSPYVQLLHSARQLRALRYRTAIIMRPDHWWGALLAKLAGIPIRIGYNLPDVKPFLTHAILHQHEHVVIQNMRLVQHWVPEIKFEKVQLRFPVSDEDRALMTAYLKQLGISRRKNLLCIHPGAGAQVKQWQPEKWAKVADVLASQLKAAVIFTGGDHEAALIKQITQQMKERAYISAGETSIGQLAALYERAKLVLGPDSGPLHLAAAVGTPTVALYGPADPIEFGTWGSAEKHKIITTEIGCRPCRVLDWGDDEPANHPCVTAISIAQVLGAARSILNHRH